MTIEGLNRIIGIPPVKKEQETRMNQKKKQKKDSKNTPKEKEGEPSNTHTGRVDIKI